MAIKPGLSPPGSGERLRNTTPFSLRQRHFPRRPGISGNRRRAELPGALRYPHPWKGEPTCDVSQYQAELRKRQEREAQQLANLPGWGIEDIRNKIPFADDIETPKENWWKKIWR